MITPDRSANGDPTEGNMAIGNIGTISLPTGRPFSWSALVILGLLQLVGNLASIPLLRATGMTVEPIGAWFLWTALSFVIIGIGLYLGGRTGLGAPLMEGRLPREERWPWARRVLALSLAFAILASLLMLPLNAGRESDDYPASWRVLLAAIDAGVQEEVFSRLFLLTLFVWLGGFLRRESGGRPAASIIWSAILLSGVLFGWAHIDDEILNPDFHAPFAEYALVMAVGTLLGIALGWLYWKQGLECAILAHFFADAMAAGIVLPVYMSGNLIAQVALWIGLGLVAVICWRVLTHTGARLAT
jgi:membrane protease YdiL (CAAX protease family)